MNKQSLTNVGLSLPPMLWDFKHDFWGKWGESWSLNWGPNAGKANTSPSHLDKFWEVFSSALRSLFLWSTLPGPSLQWWEHQDSRASYHSVRKEQTPQVVQRRVHAGPPSPVSKVQLCSTHRSQHHNVTSNSHCHVPGSSLPCGGNRVVGIRTHVEQKSISVYNKWMSLSQGGAIKQTKEKALRNPNSY